MSKAADLREELKKLGVTEGYNSRTKVADLEALLADAKAKAGAGDEGGEGGEGGETEGGEKAADSGAAAPVEDGEGKKAPDSVEKTGQFRVVVFGKEVALYNDEGVRVSPVHGVDETNDEGTPVRTVLARQAARSNALNRSRATATPKGHEG